MTFHMFKHHLYVQGLRQLPFLCAFKQESYKGHTPDLEKLRTKEHSVNAATRK
jgi:hypothetical protein